MASDQFEQKLEQAKLNAEMATRYQELRKMLGQFQKYTPKVFSMRLEDDKGQTCSIKNNDQAVLSLVIDGVSRVFEEDMKKIREHLDRDARS